MKQLGLMMLGVGAALMITGVVIEGTQRNPWNLAASYLFPLGVVESFKRRATPVTYVLFAVVAGLSVYGAAWTLGPEHATAPRAALVYVGLVGAVMSSFMDALTAGYGRANEGKP